MAVSGNDGRLYLLDATSLKTPLYVTPKYSNAGATGGLATWESEGTRWILAPAVGAAQPGLKVAANGPVTNGSVVAFKLVDDGRQAVARAGLGLARSDVAGRAAHLQRRRLCALDRRASRPANANAAAAQRAKASVPAVLYALDPATGKETVVERQDASPRSPAADLSAAAGQVYLVTFDNTLYAFGIPDGALKQSAVGSLSRESQLPSSRN